MSKQSASAYRVLSDTELVQLIYSDPEAMAAFVEAMVIMNSGGRPQIFYSDAEGYCVEDAASSVVN